MTDKNLSKKIDQLTDAVFKLVSIPVIPAIPAIAPIAPIAPIPAIPAISYTGDHDLLQRIDTKVDRVINDVAKIDGNYSGRIDKLESDKLGKTEFEEFKKITNDNVVILQTTKNSQTLLLSIGIGLLVLLTSMLIYHLFGVKI
jgi:hypothetical protein